MEKKHLVSKLYHINLQLIDQLYYHLDQEWKNCNDSDNLDQKYKDMIWMNTELNNLLEYFDDPNEKKIEVETSINWNKTMKELLPVIWFYYYYRLSNS